MLFSLGNITELHLLFIIVSFVLFCWAVKITKLYYVRQEITDGQNIALLSLLVYSAAPVVASMVLAAIASFTSLAGGQRGYSACMAVIVIAAIPLWNLITGTKRLSVSNLDDITWSTDSWAIGLIMVLSSVMIMQAQLLTSATYAAPTMIVMGGAVAAVDIFVLRRSVALYRRSYHREPSGGNMVAL